MLLLLHIGCIIGAFLAMEGVAWAAHKYIMHGVGWGLHRDHHQPGPDQRFQRNDWFALIFAVPSWLFMQTGVMGGCDWRLYVGIGILLYGIAYVYVHEVVIHNRPGRRRKVRGRYLQGLARAHFAHHKHKGPEHGECFGMLLVPLKYFRAPAD
ncbi:MAG: sterol desaturase family protein [Flavobacteriales bacterium]|nr:sterol desaturase family protein [Flavobacteriales bacterium]